MNLKNINKKLYLYTGIAIGAIIGFFIIVLIIKLIIGNKIDFVTLEDKMKTVAEKYYKENEDLLPKENGGTVSITLEELISKEYIKPLEKTLKDSTATCTGKVAVSKNNGYYLYTPNLDCNDKYKTTYLAQKILSNETIVTAEDGLYKIGEDYVYRGEDVNNYVKFANKTWRILRVISNNTIRLIEVEKRDTVIWDDRYNVDQNYTSGINSFSISRIRDTLSGIYNNKDEFSNSDKSKLALQSLCIGKRSVADETNDGSIECSNRLDNEPIGLLQLNEYFLASIAPDCNSVEDNQCQNYNYLAKFDRSFWTLTADSNKTYKVYKISTVPISTNAGSASSIKLVINLTSDSIYNSGNGTLEKPYTIK